MDCLKKGYVSSAGTGTADDSVLGGRVGRDILGRVLIPEI
ncbi:uncharacterized protein G2W53_024009 [Senna tora]|uniref:Uncharacterized protein n=1 Tax=Senna tora TaxID=362788 RepID=A0A834WIR1_9FABA|nr:uncharacterized protein G2W53_024009 [Senna tora]